MTSAFAFTKEFIQPDNISVGCYWMAALVALFEGTDHKIQPVPVLLHVPLGLRVMSHGYGGSILGSVKLVWSVNACCVY